MAKMKQELSNKVWNAVYDKFSLEPDFDPAEAVKLADKVKRALLTDSELALAELKETRRKKRHNFLKKFGWWILGIVIFLVVVSAIAFGIYSYNPAKHYANYARKDVPVAASDAIFAYFGQNDLPANLQLVRAEHSTIFGRPAWKVRYKNSNTSLCVFLWTVPDVENGKVPRSRIVKGSEC